MKNNLMKELELTKGENLKLALNLSIFLFALFTFTDKSFSLTDYR